MNPNVEEVDRSFSALEILEASEMLSDVEAAMLAPRVAGVDGVAPYMAMHSADLFAEIAESFVFPFIAADMSTTRPAPGRAPSPTKTNTP
mmetsp:Transcript_42781/g.115385  ORF Transcript_42781/g.115385 Transcript_42781/m.115385 type:complete len:90 (-) Transcript_42781:20-289(-)